MRGRRLAANRHGFRTFWRSVPIKIGPTGFPCLRLFDRGGCAAVSTSRQLQLFQQCFARSVAGEASLQGVRHGELVCVCRRSRARRVRGIDGGRASGRAAERGNLGDHSRAEGASEGGDAEAVGEVDNLTSRGGDGHDLQEAVTYQLEAL